jgi:oligopeptide/dipeptide ABC transporter ATP-binding protein
MTVPEQTVKVPVRGSRGRDARARGDRLLLIDDLTVAFPTYEGVVYGVDHISLAVGTHERLGVVGESGSGKSVMGLAMLGLVQPPGTIVSGSVLWRGENMLDPAVAERVRGREIAMIFQDPMVSLNPLKTVGAQLREVLRKRAGLDRGQAQRRAFELLDLVGIAQPKERLKQYPFEFSGGMRQRIMIATALAGDPSLLIADEPTTGLDVTIQDQILRLLQELSEDLGVSVLMITHDLGVIADFCDRVQVMYGGKIVERSPVEPIFANPLHPYTKGLMASVPRVDTPTDQLIGIPGEPLDRARLTAGCVFAPRCPEAVDVCAEKHPDLLRTIEDRRWVACWRRQMDGLTVE